MEGIIGNIHPLLWGGYKVYGVKICGYVKTDIIFWEDYYVSVSWEYYVEM